MKRRSFFGTVVSLAGFSKDARSASAASFPPLVTAHADWIELLPPERYGVLFREDTEFAGSSPLNGEKRPGSFICAACFLPLFESAHKYESGTGWPSFTQPVEGHVATRTDFRMILPRTEYHCARCGGHQGHVFKDGPAPRHERWCNNGLALQFVLAGTALPELRK